MVWGEGYYCRVVTVVQQRISGVFWGALASQMPVAISRHHFGSILILTVGGSTTHQIGP